jgi:glycosyltransferase involved in cell wall biosynthesis
LKILVVILGKRKGRSAKYYKEHSEYLLDTGFDVTCLTYEGDSILDILPGGASITTIKDFGQWDPLAAWKLKKEVNAIKPDMIMVHGYRAITLFNKANFNIPVVSVCYDSNIKHILDSDRVVVTTKSLRSYLVKSGKDPLDIYYVPNSLANKKLTKYKSFKMNAGVPTIGTIGRLKKKNGLNVLIKAMGILRTRGVKFRVRIAGEGAELERLKQLAVDVMVDDLVEFCGWVDNREEFIKGVDVICLPTLKSNTYSTILESFAYLKPVIATSVEGHNEILIADKNAILVPGGEADSLAVACEHLVSNLDIALGLTKEGYKTVTENYSQDRTRGLLKEAVESIANEHRSGVSI